MSDDTTAYGNRQLDADEVAQLSLYAQLTGRTLTPAEEVAAALRSRKPSRNLAEWVSRINAAVNRMDKGKSFTPPFSSPTGRTQMSEPPLSQSPNTSWERISYETCSSYRTWKERVTYAWGFLGQATKELDLEQIQAVQRGLDRAVRELQP